MSRRPRGPEPWDTPPRVASSTPFERSARFWLGAYPRRWRDQHGDELIGVLEAVARDAGAPFTRRLPRTEVAGLVKAGLSLRLRERPPVWRWFGYRYLSMRLPSRYWWWVADDIRSPWFPAIDATARFGAAAVGILIARLATGSSGADPFFGSLGWWFWVAYILLLSGLAYLARNASRRRAWLKHVVDGNVPESIRAMWTAAGTMAPGVDPAITGESPEERPARAQ